MSDSEIAELCRKIYARHQRALDLIFEHRPDLQADLADALGALITGSAQEHGLELDQSEKSYIRWIVRFVKFHKCEKHPREMGAAEVEQFLTHLAVNRKVAPSTQNQALCALLFLYREVLGLEDFTEEDIAAIEASEPPESAKAFDHELDS